MMVVYSNPIPSNKRRRIFTEPPDHPTNVVFSSSMFVFCLERKKDSTSPHMYWKSRKKVLLITNGGLVSSTLLFLWFLFVIILAMQLKQHSNEAGILLWQQNASEVCEEEKQKTTLDSRYAKKERNEILSNGSLSWLVRFARILWILHKMH